MTDKQNLYIKALTALIDSTPKRYWERPIDRDLSNLYVLKKEEIIKTLPSRIKETSINYFTDEELKRTTIDRKKQIPVIVIFPMKNENNLIKVSMNNY